MADNNTPYKEIPLTQGKTALVDADDYERVSRFRWRARFKYNAYYAVRGQLLLHRFILNAPRHLQVDHRDGNTLNCRKANLRLATPSQNQCNRGKDRDNTTGFKGVIKRPDGRYYAQLRKQKQSYYGGSFDNAVDAAKAYDQLAAIHHGEFARLNFPVKEQSK